MARGQRTTKGSGRQLPSARALQGRSGYFPTKTGRRKGLPQLSQDSKTQAPLDWPGTLPEWALYQAALTLGFKPDSDFAYQYQLGPGVDSEVDFIFPPAPGGHVIEVQGLFWHYQFGGLNPVNDAEKKARIQAAGYEYTAIDEDNLVGPRADPVYYLRAALEGRDYSRAML
jgi:hypothetical protein